MSETARRLAGTVLAVLAALSLLAAVVVGYAKGALFDSDGFAERASVALEDDAVAAEVGRRVADELIATDPDLVAIRPILEEVVAGVARGHAFRELFRAAVADVHRTLFSEDADTFTLKLADIGATARGAIQALNPNLAAHIPAGFDVDLLEGDPPDALVEASQIAEEVEPLPWLFLGLALVLGAGALVISADRRSAALVGGVALGISAVVAIVALSAVQALLIGAIEVSEARDAAKGLWDAYLGDLSRTLYLVAAAGAVVAAAASSLVRPVDVGAPLRRAWQLVSTTPEHPGARALRGVALLLAGILILLHPDGAVRLVVFLAGLYVAYAGAAELMRLTFAGPRAAEDAPRGRRALAVSVLAGAVILAAGAIFVGAGGIEEEAGPIETTGCNGSEALCDRPLEEVAMAATHNAMSAATYPNWLFAQQDAGIGEQLRDGVRGLLIDAHYGTPTEDGTVLTDLSDLDRGERATYEEALGPDALDAALRTRDRILGSEPAGDTGVYLCHRFCELGAITIEKGFGEIRDFLAANPDEVVVIVIEDYVEAQDIEAAAESSGLIDYVYTGALDPLPTLQEIIESGGRAVMMAENDSGDVPWYHLAYEDLVQETPYSFKQVDELTEPKLLPASCEPNRGPADAPLFLLNHWIDTSPAPRPSNAAKVNATDPLTARIRECESIRDQSVNLVAVDFYREGNVFDVVRALNEEPG